MFNPQQYVIDALSAQESWRLFRIMAELVEGFEDLNGLPPCVSIFGSARPKADNQMYQETVKVARVTNLTRTLEMLKNKGVWLYAADMVGEDYRTVNFDGACAIIIGAEGEGVSRLVLETCDHKVSLPMKGGVGSLNASVAAGVLLYAAFAGRA